MENVTLMQGNAACVEAAIAAGMKFYAGYPITPSSEIAERSALKLPQVGGKFVQMEDEIGGIAASIGASLAGTKSMTATSGPGMSLKAENLGYAMVAEAPLVVVNVQRMGPSTGLPTAPSQGDIMMAKWGTHGDHPVICLYPTSVTEIYEMTIKAFNLAEKFRTPVILLMDEVIGHMREKIVLRNEVEAFDRVRIYDESNPLKDEVLPMPAFGTGAHTHTTGLFHTDGGRPNMSAANAQKFMDRIMNKVEKHKDEIVDFEELHMEDAEYCIVSYGITARTSKAAVKRLREEGIKVGLLKVKTIWPSPDEKIVEISKKVKGILVAELNLGQYIHEVQRLAGSCPVKLCGRTDGEVFNPTQIVQMFKEVF